MIELKEIKKTYKSKKGISTEALKGINLKFGEKGLTFILGKSGSGKSTLLNILGGLDTYSSGELIINGKSSKKFKEKDWDAYRNTYMGFVFQEFNLLENYTIEDNIKLALELQHKKPTKTEVLKSLKMVDLEDILKRKPNELSGGQKQRVAIARALIKNPEIIIADEPTGNLDSSTSEQIFEILKKLSKEKLVIVVSHDEESAKKYADRVIKISDGLIESDSNTKEIENKVDFKLINAKLPFLYSLKMGLGNLFHKKIKLIFSIILIVLCLCCFGIMISTLDTDVNKEYLKAFEKNGSTEVLISKYKSKVDYEKLFSEQMKNFFDMEALEELYPVPQELDDDFLNEVEKNTKMDWYGTYEVYNNFNVVNWIYDTGFNDNQPLYYYIGGTPISTQINLIKMDENLLSELNLLGNQPINNDEVVISSYTADMIMYNGIQSKTDKNSNKSTAYKPTSYEQIINDNIYVNFGDLMYVKIVGIVDYTEYLSKYMDLKETKASTMWDMDYSSDEYINLDKLYSDLIYDDMFLTRVYVSESFIQNLDQKDENLSNSSSKMIYKDKTFDINVFGYLNKETEIFLANNSQKVSNLNSNEIVINIAMLNTITNGDYQKKLEEYMFWYDITDTSGFLKQYLNTNNIINTEVKTSINNNKIYNDSSNFATYKIIGIVNDKLDYSVVYYNKDVINKLLSDNIKMTSLFKNVETTEELETIIKYYPIDKSDTLSNSKYSDYLLTSIQISSLFKLVGKYGTLFFLIFASLLLMNFISNSIRFRKKEIGILRAIGCRSVDIIKMFLYECLTLMVICIIISSLIIPKIVNSINGFLSSTLYMKMDIMQFGIVQILGITGIMILIVIIASVLPIRKLTKSKPIDTILGR